MFPRYLVSTICGSSCPPSPDIIVAILFWIGPFPYSFIWIRITMRLVMKMMILKKHVQISGYFNSTLNPIIYVMTNHEFKVRIQKINHHNQKHCHTIHPALTMQKSGGLHEHHKESFVLFKFSQWEGGRCLQFQGKPPKLSEVKPG